MWSRRKFIGSSCSGIGMALAQGAYLPQLAANEGKATLATGKPPLSSAQLAVESAHNVLTRTLGARAKEFHLEWIEKVDSHDVYEISAQRGEVHIKGSSGAAIARGAYQYLRSQCQVMICWSGNHLDLPAKFPDASPQRVVCPYRHVQYYNPCTFGYTTAFWNWERWEQELDWMALHGINMPLAMEGQEAIWQKVWKAIGLSPVEIDQFSTGPAYLPWHRMGNINNFEGPLPQGWIAQKCDLQKKILARIRELGMTPVVPGFSGFVPQGFLRLRPDARTFTLLWLPRIFHTIPRNTRTFILHPGEQELYKDLGGRFIREYKAEYGEVEYYLADTFNELDVPVRPSHRYEDLELFGRTVYEGILAGDPNGKWVMQGWMFAFDTQFWDDPSIKALLSGVPKDRLMILDYANDHVPSLKEPNVKNQWKAHQAFFGTQWANGMAHTFGGNNNIKGNLPLIASQPVEVLHAPDKGNLVGWSLCPEGIENNEVAYELLTDMGWQAAALNLPDWIASYGFARYGSYPQAMKEAWRLLLESAYSNHTWMTKPGWQQEPNLAVTAIGVDAGPKFQQATEIFLSCAGELGEKKLYRNDLIEFVVQAAGGYVDRQLNLAGNAHKEHQPESRDRSAAAAIEMLHRMDALLNLRPDRRLETWTTAARSWAKSNDESAFYDENARRLLTVWGWPELSDYAARAWSGLTRDYYAARWSAYFEALKENKPFSLDIWQQTWLSSPYRPSPPRPVNDLVQEARDMLATCKSWGIESV